MSSFIWYTYIKLRDTKSPNQKGETTMNKNYEELLNKAKENFNKDLEEATTYSQEFFAQSNLNFVEELEKNNK